MLGRHKDDPGLQRNERVPFTVDYWLIVAACPLYRYRATR
jgi:hypothetical protein